MATLNRLRELEDLQKQHAEEIARLQNDPSIKREVEFENKLLGLLNEYGKSIHDAVQLVAPELLGPRKYKPREKPHKKVDGYDGVTSSGKPDGRSTRPPTLFFTCTNPHTGESVYGGNMLKKPIPDWCRKYGRATVQGWCVYDNAAPDA